MSLGMYTSQTSIRVEVCSGRWWQCVKVEDDELTLGARAGATDRAGNLDGFVMLLF